MNPFFVDAESFKSESFSKQIPNMIVIFANIISSTMAQVWQRHCSKVEKEQADRAPLKF